MSIKLVLAVYSLDDDRVTHALGVFGQARGPRHKPSLRAVRDVLLYLATRTHDHRRKGVQYVDESLGVIASQTRLGHGTVRDVIAFLGWCGVVETIRAGGRNRAPHRLINIDYFPQLLAASIPRDRESDSDGISGGIHPAQSNKDSDGICNGIETDAAQTLGEGGGMYPTPPKDLSKSLPENVAQLVAALDGATSARPLSEALRRSQAIAMKYRIPDGEPQ